MTRRQLSDSEWELIEPFLPVGQYGPYPQRLREQFEGLVWRFRTGSQWREMPREEFGAWQTVYERFAQWRDAGVFASLLEGMIAEAARRGQADMSLVSVDSTVARAHHDAAGMVVDPEVLTALEEAAAEKKGQRKPGKNDPGTAESQEREADRAERRRVRRQRRARLTAAALGRSRGGLPSKVHLAADLRCRPLAFVLTPGQAADSPQFVAVLENVRLRGPVGRPRPDAVAADRAYSSRVNRAHLRKHGIKAVIPEKADQAAIRKKRGSAGGRPVSHDAEQYKDRNTVERCINRIWAWRGLATRYDKTPGSYMAGLQLRSSIIWMRSLDPAT